MRLLFITIFYAVTCATVYGIELPPSLGKQTPENQYRSALKLIYENDFESLGDVLPTHNNSVFYTTAPSQVLSGQHSLFIRKDAIFEIGEDSLALTGGATYTVEFEYALTAPANDQFLMAVGFTWPGFDDGFSGPIQNNHPLEGTYRHNMRLPIEQSDISLTFVALASDTVIDKIRIYQLVPENVPAKPNLLTFGFPRLSNFQVFSSAFIANLYGEDVADVRAALARFDFVNGLTIDHSFGNEHDYLNLKHHNPDIMLLAYQPSFFSVLVDTNPPFGGAAGLFRQFNQGLQEDWFMRDGDGNKLPELLYPDNFQMNHTLFCPEVDGFTYIDYTSYFLQESVLPSGYWSGIHFDQSEWFPNPLLTEEDPFNNQSSVTAPMDLDNDGEVETEGEIYLASLNAFIDYFSDLDSAMGSSVILFGNAGEMSMQEDVLRRLNGFQFEFFSPYPMNEDGSYATSRPSFWYRYLNINERARTLLRSPQVPSTQMTGNKLGSPNGNTTINGVADREPVLTPADYHRMRFGLTTTLMTDGFFGYDFVDNTTLPYAWLDEYAIDVQSGQPDPKAKHYLGQPLGDAIELNYAHNDLIHIDFENGIPSNLPAGVYLNEDLVLTDDPAFLIDGAQSALLSVTLDPENPDAFASIFATDQTVFPLNADTTFQVFMDYRLVSYDSQQFGPLFSIGIISDTQDTDITNTSSVWYRDASTNQQGSLRAAIKTDSTDYFAAGVVNDDVLLVVDNIRILEGNGGVYRRDFEHGVVLVNPTPNPRFVTLNQIKGSWQRTGLRHIDGQQVPTVNHGQAVTGDILLPSGDGIILLADKVTAPAPQTPTNLQPINIGNDLLLRWQESAGTVSGYVIQYGYTFGALNLYKTVGRTNQVLLTNLAPGRAYDIKIAAFDYLGNLSPYTTVATHIQPGPQPLAVPQFVLNGNFTADAIVTLTGLNLATHSESFTPGNYPLQAANTQVLLNGVPAPLASVSATQINFLVPGNLAGDTVNLRVEREGISSSVQTIPVTNQTRSQIPVFSHEVDTIRNMIHIDWNSTPFVPYVIETSRDLMLWTPWGKPQIPLTGYTQSQIELDLNAQPAQFFRIVEMP